MKILAINNNYGKPALNTFRGKKEITKTINIKSDSSFEEDSKKLDEIIEKCEKAGTNIELDKQLVRNFSDRVDYGYYSLIFNDELNTKIDIQAVSKTAPVGNIRKVGKINVTTTDKGMLNGKMVITHTIDLFSENKEQVEKLLTILDKNLEYFYKSEAEDILRMDRASSKDAEPPF